MKKSLTKFGEQLFSGANLIALGTVLFYRAIYRIFLVGLGTLHGQLSWLTAKT